MMYGMECITWVGCMGWYITTSKPADFYEIIRVKGAEKQAVSLRNGPEKQTVSLFNWLKN